jgi:hypothetical protein
MFFTMPMAAPASGTDLKKVEELFAKYKTEDADDDMIGAAGIEQFCEDIGVRTQPGCAPRVRHAC